MAGLKTYDIIFSTDFPDWSRYDVFMMAACRDEAGKQTDFVNLVSRGGANNEVAAASSARRKLKMTAPSCASFELYIYIVSATLPVSTLIEQHPPFEGRLRILDGQKALFDRPYEINQWGGATIHIFFPTDKG